MILTHFSPANPLAALIGRHKGCHTYAELAAASKGAISASRWEQLEDLPLGAQPTLTPADIAAIALALHLTPSTVRHYVLASRDLPVPVGPPSGNRVPQTSGAVGR